MANICVFCGSRNGVRPDFVAASRAFGTALAERGHVLVFGGGNIGLMGAAADAVIEAGGTTIGIMPHLLADHEIAHTGLSEMIFTADMHARKAVMHERSDAYVALPGGYGTIEEFAEVLSWRQIGILDKPIGFLNMAGIYDGLFVMLETMAREGFLDAATIRDYVVEQDPIALLDRLL